MNNYLCFIHYLIIYFVVHQSSQSPIRHYISLVALTAIQTLIRAHAAASIQLRMLEFNVGKGRQIHKLI